MRRLAAILALAALAVAAQAEMDPRVLWMLSSASRVPVDGLVAWWDFDDASGATNVTARVGTGLDMSLVYGTASIVQGKLDYGVSLPAFSWHRSPTGALAQLTNSFSVALWRKRAGWTYSGGGDCIISRTVASGSFNAAVNAFVIYDATAFGKRTAFGICKGAALSFAIADATNSTLGWEHIAATYDGATMRLYIGGVMQTTNTALAGPINAASTATVNFNTYQNNGDFSNQTLDDVLIYDRKLEQDEISNLAGY